MEEEGEGTTNKNKFCGDDVYVAASSVLTYLTKQNIHWQKC